jgi:RNA polymerase sigma factor (sigma-70 family)
MSAPEHAIRIENLLRHRAWVRGVARALVRGDQDADDLEQEAWLAAVNAPPPEGGSPRAWLGTVLRRTAAKVRLRDERREKREQASARDGAMKSPAELVAAAEMHERVVRAVLALPEPYRAAVLWRYFEGLSPGEISRRTGTPIETVRSRLRRALMLLRADFQEKDSRSWPATLVALAGAPSAKQAGVVVAGVVLMTQAKTAVLATLAIVVAVAVVIWAVWDRGVPAPEGDGPGLTEAPAKIEAPPGPASATAPAIRPRAFDPQSESEPASRVGPADGTAALTVRVLWGEDKTPAAGVGVHAIEWGARSGMWKQHDRVTGGDGTFRMTGVAPGRVGFYVDRGGGKAVELAGGDDQDVTLEIPPGPTVLGVVIDHLGTPVAGADVWLSQYGNERNGAVVARSDEKGEFSLRCVGDARCVAARARGHVASAVVRIAAAKPGETVRVRIALGGAAGSVSGVVTRADGTRVAGATVLGWPSGGEGLAWRDRQDPPPPIRTHTDELGGFVLDSLPPGKNPVEVRIAGLAPWAGAAVVNAGEVTQLEVRLLRAAVVFGTVKLASGAPVEKAFVGVGGYGDFLSSMTRTAADGSFRLDSLAPGSIEIRASMPEVGKVTATLLCEEGAEARWDAVLDSGLRIAGVVRDDQDRPLAGWIVNARTIPDNHTWWGQSTTDAAGRFNVTNCPPQAKFRLEVVDRKAAGGAAIRAFVDDVTPGDADVVIRVAGAVARATGRIVGPDGKPAVAIVRLTPPRDMGTVTVESVPETGAFTTGALLPGRWRITLDRKPVGTLDLGEHEIGQGATLDLGEIRLAAAGRLVIDLAASFPAADLVTYEIRPQPANEPEGIRIGGIQVWFPSLKVAHRDLPSPLELAPGRYALDVAGPGLAPRSLTFEVTSGAETKTRVVVERAAEKH